MRVARWEGREEEEDEEEEDAGAGVVMAAAEDEDALIGVLGIPMDDEDEEDDEDDAGGAAWLESAPKNAGDICNCNSARLPALPPLPAPAAPRPFDADNKDDACEEDDEDEEECCAPAPDRTEGKYPSHNCASTRASTAPSSSAVAASASAVNEIVPSAIIK